MVGQPSMTFSPPRKKKARLKSPKRLRLVLEVLASGPVTAEQAALTLRDSTLVVMPFYYHPKEGNTITMTVAKVRPMNKRMVPPSGDVS